MINHWFVNRRLANSRSLATSCLVAALLGAAVLSLRGQGVVWQPPDESGQGQTPVMPVHQEPHHRQVFQYGPLRIIDLQIPPGDMSWFHTHDWPVFYLTVADSQTRTQILGEEWGAGRARGAGPRGAGGGAAAGADGAAAGARAAAPPAAPPAGGARTGGPPRFRPRLMSDLSYAERQVTHRIHNSGTGLYRAIGVINETQGGDETVSEAAAGFAGKAEMSNRWFRIHRIALAPGEKAPPHQHNAAVVILQDSAGSGAATGPMTFEFNEAGQWGFFDSGARHEITNKGNTRLELIEVELRRR
jgi:mannose-6-phosphate isomerase-like protein (cupin superfamily)